MTRSVLFLLPAILAVAFAGELKCRLDSKVNADTFPDYVNNHELGFIYESACGRNRGIFVVEPADGHTYNCAKFPEVWNTTDANAVMKDGNPAHAVWVLDQFVQSVYASTPEYVRRKDPSSCDFEALTAFTCEKEEPWRTAPWGNK
jgi:hypothetical protein